MTGTKPASRTGAGVGFKPLATQTARHARAALNRNESRKRSGSLVIKLLFLVFLVPTELSINLGSVNIPVYRLFLLLMITPAFIRIVKGVNGGFTLIDFFVFSYSLWCVSALLHASGLENWQACGTIVIETLSPYLIARAYMTCEADWASFVRFYFMLILFLLPFALIETFGKFNIFKEFATGGHFAGTEPRFGLNRAYGPFEHPIHFGIFCAAIIGMIVAQSSRLFAKAWRMVVIAVAVFCSLSSAALLLFVVQIILTAWHVAARKLSHHWRILAAGVAILYVAIDLVSNRGAFHVLVSYATLNTQSAYVRFLIWNYGVASVMNFPIFGIGLGEWERPRWMGASIDNFWLLTAVRYGLPALFFLVLAQVVLFKRLASAALGVDLARCRRGWGISITALIFAGATVHYWNALYCLFMFFLGASSWMMQDADASAGAVDRGEGEGSVRRDTRGEFSRSGRPSRKQDSTIAGSLQRRR